MWSEDTGLGNRGPELKSIVVPYGFWLFVLSDMVLFFDPVRDLRHACPRDRRRPRSAAAVRPELGRGRDGRSAVVELRLRAGDDHRQAEEHGVDASWLVVTGLLGFIFLSIEFYEFAHMIGEGAPPQRSAFLSSFFTLVGCHGAHVTAGLLWLGTMMAQIWAKGFRQDIVRRLLCFSVFWHALDIIWVAIFTIVYLIGTLA